MKCLNRTEIQEFLDKEVEPSLMARISDHIEKCETCAMLYTSAVKDRELINKFLGNDTDEKISIPEFRQPKSARRRNLFYRTIPLIAAVTIIAVVLLLRSDRQPVTEKIPEAEIIINEFYEGKDLNKLWHDKTQLLIIQDDKGNVIQSIITN
jgi:hypothetical protein